MKTLKRKSLCLSLAVLFAVCVAFGIASSHVAVNAAGGSADGSPDSFVTVTNEAVTAQYGSEELFETTFYAQSRGGFASYQLTVVLPETIDYDDVAVSDVGENGIIEYGERNGNVTITYSSSGNVYGRVSLFTVAFYLSDRAYAGVEYYFEVYDYMFTDENAEVLEVVFDLNPITVEGYLDRAKGDFDGDGEVTLVDVMYMQRYIVGKIGMEEDVFAACDIDGNGVINIQDCQYVQMYLVGKLDDLDNVGGGQSTTYYVFSVSYYFNGEYQFKQVFTTGDAYTYGEVLYDIESYFRETNKDRVIYEDYDLYGDIPSYYDYVTSDKTIAMYFYGDEAAENYDVEFEVIFGDEPVTSYRMNFPENTSYAAAFETFLNSFGREISKNFGDIDYERTRKNNPELTNGEVITYYGYISVYIALDYSEEDVDYSAYFLVTPTLYRNSTKSEIAAVLADYPICVCGHVEINDRYYYLGEEEVTVTEDMLGDISFITDLTKEWRLIVIYNGHELSLSVKKAVESGASVVERLARKEVYDGEERYYELIVYDNGYISSGTFGYDDVSFVRYTVKEEGDLILYGVEMNGMTMYYYVGDEIYRDLSVVEAYVHGEDDETESYYIAMGYGVIQLTVFNGCYAEVCTIQNDGKETYQGTTLVEVTEDTVTFMGTVYTIGGDNVLFVSLPDIEPISVGYYFGYELDFYEDGTGYMLYEGNVAYTGDWAYAKAGDDSAIIFGISGEQITFYKWSDGVYYTGQEPDWNDYTVKEVTFPDETTATLYYNERLGYAYIADGSYFVSASYWSGILSTGLMGSAEYYLDGSDLIPVERYEIVYGNNSADVYMGDGFMVDKYGSLWRLTRLEQASYYTYTVDADGFIFSYNGSEIFVAVEGDEENVLIVPDYEEIEYSKVTVYVVYGKGYVTDIYCNLSVPSNRSIYEVLEEAGFFGEYNYNGGTLVVHDGGNLFFDPFMNEIVGYEEIVNGVLYYPGEYTGESEGYEMTVFYYLDGKFQYDSILTVSDDYNYNNAIFKAAEQYMRYNSNVEKDFDWQLPEDIDDLYDFVSGNFSVNIYFTSSRPQEVVYCDGSVEDVCVELGSDFATLASMYDGKTATIIRTIYAADGSVLTDEYYVELSADCIVDEDYPLNEICSFMVKICVEGIEFYGQVNVIEDIEVPEYAPIFTIPYKYDSYRHVAVYENGYIYLISYDGFVEARSEWYAFEDTAGINSDFGEYYHWELDDSWHYDDFYYDLEDLSTSTLEVAGEDRTLTVYYADGDLIVYDGERAGYAEVRMDGYILRIYCDYYYAEYVIIDEETVSDFRVLDFNLYYKGVSNNGTFYLTGDNETGYILACGFTEILGEDVLLLNYEFVEEDGYIYVCRGEMPIFGMSYSAEEDYYNVLGFFAFPFNVVYIYDGEVIATETLQFIAYADVYGGITENGVWFDGAYFKPYEVYFDEDLEIELPYDYIFDTYPEDGEVLTVYAVCSEAEAPFVAEDGAYYLVGVVNGVESWEPYTDDYKFSPAIECLGVLENVYLSAGDLIKICTGDCRDWYEFNVRDAVSSRIIGQERDEYGNVNYRVRQNGVFTITLGADGLATIAAAEVSEEGGSW